MLTLITGTPGAGKTLHAVWHFAKPVPGSTVEDKQGPVPRRLLSNIKGLLIEHETIDAEDLNNWHTWAKPGDVILFDEVQEVWRPRGLGSKVPEAIAALETHRHMGVDIIIVTQHPMLLDPNIRRLVNQHIHLRRMTKTFAMLYEWDHAEQPGNTRTCVASRVWRHPKKAYDLYKSAQLHTKPTVRVPAIAYVGLLALAGLAYAGPAAYSRIAGTMGSGDKGKSPIAPMVEPGQAQKTEYTKDGIHYTVEKTVSQIPQAPASAPVETALAPVVQPILAGCIATTKKCACVDTTGQPMDLEPALCKTKITGNSEPGQKADISHLDNNGQPGTTQSDVEVLAFMKANRQ